MPGKKHECRGCKKFMRSDNLKRHEKRCKEGILCPQDPIIPEEKKCKNNMVDASTSTTLNMKNIPPLNASGTTDSSIIQIKSEQEETDSEEGDSLSDDDLQSEDMEFHQNNPEKIRQSFRELYAKLHDDSDNLHILLSKLERTNCLTYKECKAICDYFKEKIDDF